MSKEKAKEQELIEPVAEGLFQRVAAILDQARSNVARSVNSNMVLAYWLSGREIVLVVQEGEERAEYGKRVLETLSGRLAERFGRGFSVANLKNFRQFYLIYPDRIEIRYPAGSELPTGSIRDPVGSDFAALGKLAPSAESLAAGVPAVVALGDAAPGFSPQLSWSHYRALMRVSDSEARDFYEREAAECGWTKSQLERQIQSSYFQRIIANRGAAGLVAADRERLPGEPSPAEAILKSPYVLEFLSYPILRTP